MSPEQIFFSFKQTLLLKASNKTTLALVAVFVALILYACLPILLKISEFNLTPNATIFNRCWIATTILGCWNGLLSLKKDDSEQSLTIQFLPSNFSNSWFLLCLLAILSVGHFLFYAWSLTQTSVANSEVLHSLTPLFTAFVGWIFLGQQFDRRFLFGIAIAIGGSIALVANDLSMAIDKLQGDGLAIVSAIFWSGCLLILENLKNHLSIKDITTWNEIFSTIFLFPIILGIGENIFPTSWKTWIAIIVIGIVGILARVLITYSLDRLSSSLVATILLLHPVITAVLAWMIFWETFNLINFVGFTIILFGVYLATLSEGGKIKR